MTVVVPEQQELFGAPDLPNQVERFIRDVLARRRQPSARELLSDIETALGLPARWHVSALVRKLEGDPGLTRAHRDYLRSLLDGDLARALRGEGAPDAEMVSSIDHLVRQSRVYRASEAFKDMVQFMARFRDYAPYNNMQDRWWPGRADLDHHSVEIEAEAVAYLVTSRLGLEGTSAEYISRHLGAGDIPAGVSIDHIAKTAGQLERMTTQLLPKPQPRPRKEGTA